MLINMPNTNIRTSFNIGIFYLDKGWREKIYEDLVDRLKDGHIINRRTKECILLDGGTYIRFLPVTSAARGYKFDKIYYQKDVSEEELNTIIRPTALPVIQYVFEDF